MAMTKIEVGKTYRFHIRPEESEERLDFVGFQTKGEFPRWAELCSLRNGVAVPGHFIRQNENRIIEVIGRVEQISVFKDHYYFKCYVEIYLSDGYQYYVL
jgi:hypothetical protein